jgi:hypothetical protein
MVDDIVDDAGSMADRMGRCDWQIQIALQSIEQRRGPVEMPCLGDR